MAEQKDRQNKTGQLIQLGKSRQDQQNQELDEQSFLAYASRITQLEQDSWDQSRVSEVDRKIEAKVCQVASMSKQKSCLKLKRSHDEVDTEPRQNDQVLPLKKRET